MHRLMFAFWSCFAVSFAGMATTSAQPAGNLRVMTYNLKHGNSAAPHTWKARRPAARAMLENFKPDIIGTQEGLYPQIKDLDTDLPDYTWIGTGRDGGSRGEFMAIFFRRSRFEPLEFDHFWLSDTPNVVGSTTWGNSNRRMVTWVRFIDRKTERQFYFLNTHFDHQVPDARRKSAELVIERAGTLDTELPIILVGDFNALAERSDVYERLVGAERFADSWTSAESRGEAIDTIHGYRGPRSTGRRIDWILIRGPVNSVASEVITFELEGRYPSDHFPVIADLRLR